MNQTQKTLDAIRTAAIPLNNTSSLDSVLDSIDDANLVLLGEATHGTHQFYDMRAEITKKLITEKNFNAIAIEGDWPDAYQINYYIHNQKYTRAVDALASFDRFPTWMWRNVPILELSEWLRTYNDKQQPKKKVSFYGLDLYSLYRSVDTVIQCLEKIDPAAAAQARYHYSCFANFRTDPQEYAYAVARKAIQSCESEVLEQLNRMLVQNWEHLAHGEITAQDAFNIEQNARVVKNAEHYYRAMFLSDVSCWNIRDSHMFETLNSLINYYQLQGIETPKIIIWAHNSHLGNAAATQMRDRGEYNIGQLIKEHFDKKAFSIGFTTYNGTVSAASDWHAPVERKNIVDALPDSYEALFHALDIPNFFLPLNNKDIIPQTLLERAIGVIYHPQTERQSHYFYANLAHQFDAVIHYDKSHAIEPLDKTAHWIKGEVPETYPSGF